MRARVVPKERRTADGVVFDSETEMNHYFNLKALQNRGLISKLQIHPKFILMVNEIEITTYKPDFSFINQTCASWLPNQVVIQDVKGWKKSAKTGKLLPRVDREFHIKVKLMMACFGLTVELV